MKILIFGDICPTKDTLPLFIDGHPKKLFNDLMPELAQADYVVGNLECALTDNPMPIQKAGPVLHAPSKCVNVLADAGFKALSIANNHIRDCGNSGVESTIKACEQVGISTYGAGKDYDEAAKPLIVDCGGKKIAFVSFAEKEFNAVGEGRYGAKILDPYEDFDRLRVLRKDVDFLVVQYHGGIEYFEYASPMLQKVCRKLADSGADIVTCQHSHCIGTIENYNGSTIIYGQGNSIFGYRKGNDSWNSGIVLQVEFINGRWKVTPLFIKATKTGIQMMDSEESKCWEERLHQRTGIQSNGDEVKALWQSFCNKLAPIDIPLLLGWPIWMIRINRLLGHFLARILLNQRRANITHNMIRCDAHREVIDAILSKMDYRE